VDVNVTAAQRVRYAWRDLESPSHWVFAEGSNPGWTSRYRRCIL